MGGPVFGFGGGRKDVFEPEMVYWGAEEEWLDPERRNAHLPDKRDRWKTRWPRSRWA